MELFVEASNHSSALSLNLHRGAQVNQLSLSTASGKRLDVIDSFKPEEDFFGSGSFLMFPWVNRLAAREVNIDGRTVAFDPPMSDSTGHSIHGLVFDKPRRVVDSSNTHIHLTLAESPADFPSVSELWRLEERALVVKYTFTNESAVTQKFAFGLHPYFSLGTKVDTWIIQTNMTHFHPLTHELLPGDEPPQPISQVFSQTEPLGATSLDHTLTDPVDGPPTLSIIDAAQQVKLTVTGLPPISPDSIPLRFLQVYTPPHRQSIAVEPMSAIGNVFVKFPHLLTTLLPGESKWGGFSVALEDLS
mmetsp:Transcript_23801/g.42102  ORF Transcript_23801/g.42102 Transcript_23801/m.42102 type:complete len:303 (-) Transcript_23801:17-925(-)